MVERRERERESERERERERERGGGREGERMKEKLDYLHVYTLGCDYSIDKDKLL